MEKFVRDIRIKQWAEIIESANKSCLTRRQWLAENGISKDAFYYWQRKVRKFYAEQSGLLSLSSECKGSELIEVPVAVRTGASSTMMPAAVIRIGNMSVEISSSASAEFMENLGRMIHNAL